MTERPEENGWDTQIFHGKLLEPSTPGATFSPGEPPKPHKARALVERLGQRQIAFDLQGLVGACSDCSTVFNSQDQMSAATPQHVQLLSNRRLYVSEVKPETSREALIILAEVMR